MNKPLDIFREVNRLAKVHYSNEQSSHLVFLSACHKVLAKYFEEYFKGEKSDGFIFSALSFSNNGVLHHIDENDDESKDTSYLFNENSVNDWEKLKQELRTYKNQVANDEMISITKILLDKNKTNPFKDLFFVTNNYPKDVIDNSIIFEYKLTDFNASEEIYCNSNKSQLNSFYSEYGSNGATNPYCRYVYNHHKLAEVYKSHNPDKGFFLHYIKPSIAELDYGLLLSLATNRQLTSDELAFVNLILYRVVSQTATEKMREAERLKTKTMFSLTTHSLKTHLNTTVIKTKNAFRDNKLSDYPELKQAFEEHSREVDTLFHLTELLSLIDKINNSVDFKDAATEVLFSQTIVSYNLKEHLQKFNERHTTSPDIEISPEIEVFDFSITVYDLYFGEKLLELLFNTIFENIIAYGKPIDKKKKLNIEINGECWKFVNETVDETVKFNQEQVRGNLLLFKKLINETKSGTFSIKPENYKFEIEIKKGNDE